MPVMQEAASCFDFRRGGQYQGRMLGPFTILGLLALLGLYGYRAGKRRIVLAYAAHQPHRGYGHDASAYHGWFVALHATLPALGLYLIALILGGLLDLGPPFTWVMPLVVLAVGIVCMNAALLRLAPHFAARRRVERVAYVVMWGATGLTILITFAIVGSVFGEAMHFFRLVPPSEFFFGLQWSPQTALRADQAGATGAFGIIPLLVGTLMITAIAMLIAVPAGLMSAIYLAEYATPRTRNWLKPILELLAGIPTVVYGYFAIVTIAPFIRGAGETLGLSVSSESALATGIVMGIMIIPFVSSLSDDIITAVPRGLRDPSDGLGATRSETVKRVVLRSALPGIMGAVLLAISRAIGETMIVVMAAGLSANLTANPLESMTTMTVQIVTLLVGDQEFDSPKTLAAFALGLTLFVFTLLLNIAAQQIVKRYREQYE